MDIDSVLEQLGFEPKEIRVYLATLKSGIAPVSIIAKRCRMNRTTAYVILKKLASRGIAEFFLRKTTRYYSVISPDKLAVLFQQRIDTFKEAIPNIAVLSESFIRRPQIAFYEGKEDLRRLYEDYTRSTTEVLNYFHPEKLYDALGFDFVKGTVRARMKNKKKIRCILPDTPMARDLFNAQKDENRDVLLVPASKWRIDVEIILYDDKMCLFSFEEDLGLLIESKDIVSTQKAIFELAWLGVGNL
jgi:predicted transcriptional regulator